MQKIFLLLLPGFAWFSVASQTLQLAPPQTPAARLILAPESTVSFDFRMKNAVIRYTTDGNEPDENSPVYRQPISVTKPDRIKAKSFCDGFLPSETKTVQVLSLAAGSIDSIAISPKPDKYAANGWRTLCNGQLGDENFRENWLGFDQQEVSLRCFFNKKKKIRLLTVSLMRQQGAWIFLPQAVEVFDKKEKLIARKAITNAGEDLPPSLELVEISIPKKKYRELTLRLKALPSLPEWHPGNGQSGWVFLDEVFVE